MFLTLWITACEENTDEMSQREKHFPWVLPRVLRGTRFQFYVSCPPSSFNPQTSSCLRWLWVEHSHMLFFHMMIKWRRICFFEITDVWWRLKFVTLRLQVSLADPFNSVLFCSICGSNYTTVSEASMLANYQSSYTDRRRCETGPSVFYDLWSWTLPVCRKLFKFEIFSLIDGFALVVVEILEKMFTLFLFCVYIWTWL